MALLVALGAMALDVIIGLGLKKLRSTSALRPRARSRPTIKVPDPLPSHPASRLPSALGGVSLPARRPPGGCVAHAEGYAAFFICASRSTTFGNNSLCHDERPLSSTIAN